MKEVNMDWPNLDFGYHRTKVNIRYTWKDGEWDAGRLTESESIGMHIAATCFHYGQALFEGLKVFSSKDGRALIFRVEENARRMIRGAEKLLMQPVPEKLFIEAVYKVVQANQEYIPPHGTGASLYIRPVLLGTGPQIGVKPAEEYVFMVLVTPVGPYFKTGFKPVKLIVEEEVDRAAPLGVGDVKAAGNYAAGMRASKKAKSAGYTEVLYLDAREKRYIDESGPANFFAITRNNEYVTPKSASILPSITNMSLMQLARDLGLEVQNRPVDIGELENFAEAGCCGTAAVITPVASITHNEKEYLFHDQGRTPGPWCVRLYETLTAIQQADQEDPYGWVREIPL